METFMGFKGLLTKKELMAIVYLKRESFMEFRLLLIKMAILIRSSYMKMEFLKRIFKYDYIKLYMLIIFNKNLTKII